MLLNSQEQRIKNFYQIKPATQIVARVFPKKQHLSGGQVNPHTANGGGPRSSPAFPIRAQSFQLPAPAAGVAKSIAAATTGGQAGARARSGRTR